MTAMGFRVVAGAATNRPVDCGYRRIHGTADRICHEPGPRPRPKTFAWLAGWGDVAFTGGKDIPYFLVPLCAPVVGAALGAFSYRKLIGRHLPCDTCVEEVKESTSTTQHNASL